MILTEEQIKNNYPIEAVKFFDTYDKYLSDEVDEYGIKKCNADSFKQFAEVGESYPQRLKEQYDDAVKQIHQYLKDGNNI